MSGKKEVQNEVRDLAVRYMVLNSKSWRYQSPEEFHPAVRVWYWLALDDLKRARRAMTYLESIAPTAKGDMR